MPATPSELILYPPYPMTPLAAAGDSSRTNGEERSFEALFLSAILRRVQSERLDDPAPDSPPHDFLSRWSYEIIINNLVCTSVWLEIRARARPYRVTVGEWIGSSRPPSPEWLAATAHKSKIAPFAGSTSGAESYHGRTHTWRGSGCRTGNN